MPVLKLSIWKSYCSTKNLLDSKSLPNFTRVYGSNLEDSIEARRHCKQGLSSGPGNPHKWINIWIKIWILFAADEANNDSLLTRLMINPSPLPGSRKSRQLSKYYCKLFQISNMNLNEASSSSSKLAFHLTFNCFCLLRFLLHGYYCMSISFSRL